MIKRAYEETVDESKTLSLTYRFPLGDQFEKLCDREMGRRKGGTGGWTSKGHTSDNVGPW